MSSGIYGYTEKKRGDATKYSDVKNFTIYKVGTHRFYNVQILYIPYHKGSLISIKNSPHGEFLIDIINVFIAQYERVRSGNIQLLDSKHELYNPLST